MTQTQTTKLTSTRLIDHSDHAQLYAVYYGAQRVGRIHVSYGAVNTEVTALSHTKGTKVFELMSDALYWLTEH